MRKRMAKVFEIAKRAGKESKEVLDALKAAGIAVKTPVSVVPEEALEQAKAMFPAQAVETPRIKDVIIPPPPKHVDTPVVEKLKQRPIVNVPVGGVEPRFSQCALGIRRRIVDGRKKSSLLLFYFDPDTLEVKLVEEQNTRTEFEGILKLKEELIKRKVV